jgi:hypothetical protein
VKIAIGFNLHYPLNDRVEISQKSLLKLKKQFGLTLLNMDFEGSENPQKNDDIVFLPKLTQHSK